MTHGPAAGFFGSGGDAAEASCRGGTTWRSPREERVAGRLRAHAAAWRRLGASREVLEIVEHGYRIPFTCRRSDVPTFFSPRNGDGCRAYESWLRSTIPELLAVGAIEPVQHRPRVVALVDVIPKSTPGKFRIIVDLRPLNAYVQVRAFTYETHATFRDLIEEGDLFISLDETNGYYHVDVAPEDRTYLGFRLFGQYFVFAVLPFGLRDSPYVFTEVMKVPVRYLRAELRLRVLAYLDDFLVAKQGMTKTDAAAIVQVFEDLGILLNLDKCVLTPTTRIENLGLIVDSVAMTYELTASRLRKFRDAEAEVRATVNTDGVVAARAVARISGHAAAAAIVLGRRARLHTRFLNDSVRDAAAARRWSAAVRLGPGALAELDAWRDILGSLGPSPIERPSEPTASVLLCSDASDFAWGGRVLWARSGAFPDDLRPPSARGAFAPADCERSSCWRELRAVRNVLGAVVSAGLRDEVVRHQVDSSSARFVFANGGSQNRDAVTGDLDLHLEVLDIEATAAEAHLELRLEWVPREQNQEADDDSKIRDRANYRLSYALFDWLQRHFGPHDVDRFADGDNRLLPRFNSRFASPGAEALDAFSVSWRGVKNWLHPPFGVISRTVGKLRQERACGTLIVPRWTNAPWWPALFPPGDSGPVRQQRTIPAGRESFVAYESAAALGHGQPPSWTMLALQVDFGPR